MKKKREGFSLDILADHYDRLTFTEKSRFRRSQIGMMNINPGEKILDVGCGTGSLSVLSKIAVGDPGDVIGIDIAPKMIAKAKQKARKPNCRIEFSIASVSELPFPDGYFDLVISSLMFHHLPVKVKEMGLKEIYRVLKEDGRFFLCDFGSPCIPAAPFMFLLLFWLSATRYQLLGKLPRLIAACGFKSARLVKKGFFLEYYLLNKS